MNQIRSSSSLAGRAALAVLLMIGFYLLALAVISALFFIPFGEVVYLHHVTPKLDLICLIAGVAILWSVLPRMDKFVAPGPRLTRETDPRLFAEIETVAKSVDQAMPAEVYLIPDVNAWVSQRGGIMGFGSRRVMGLGLPLMRALSRSQFRAVLAHEFGHYYGGDTRLGPWIYKTRAAIMRTVISLSGRQGKGSLLQKPFLWYGKMYLRITHGISRRQEFVADELAARAIGSRPLIAGLRTVHGAGSAFNAFWKNECLPVLHAGFRPPLAEGFHHFVRSHHVAEAINKGLDEALKTGKADPYDTHPPLKERIAAVENLPSGDPEADDPPALSLLNDVPSLEKQLLVIIAGPNNAGKLKPIGWADVCREVYLPQWKKLVEANLSVLTGVTPESLPQLAKDVRAFGRRCVSATGQKLSEGHAEGLAAAVIGAALVWVLVDRGAQLRSAPGDNISAILGSTTVEPFAVLPELAGGKLSAETWQRQCNDLGIAGLDLGKPTADPSALKPPPAAPAAGDDSQYMPGS
jgi:Zn-dependent protease with chaperone function